MSDYRLVWDRDLNELRLKRRTKCHDLDVELGEVALSGITDDLSDIVVLLVKEINELRDEVRSLQERER